MAERAVYFRLVVFQITVLAILMQYPITLSRNILVHSIVFTVYFLAVTAIYLVLSMFGYETIRIVRFPVNAVTLLALVAWMLLLKQAGKLRKQSLRPHGCPAGKKNSSASSPSSMTCSCALVENNRSGYCYFLPVWIFLHRKI